MYTFESRVRYSEVDLDGKLSLDALVNYFQDCSTFQSEDIGRGLKFLEERKRAWLLSSWQIVIDRYPNLGEEIKSGTWAYDFNGFYGSRNFVLEDKSGKRIACANSIWANVDTQTGHPVRIAEEDVAGYAKEERINMDYAPRRISISGEGIEKEHFLVRKYHIDTNGHVNNGKYIQIAREFISADKKVRQVRAEYRKPAVYGDLFIPELYASKGCEIVVLKSKDGIIYAVVEFEE